jgi:hypothetical protein
MKMLLIIVLILCLGTQTKQIEEKVYVKRPQFLSEEPPGSPPNNIKVNALSSRSISVTWDPPNVEQQHGVIRGYYIGYKIFGSASQFVYKTLEIREGTREEVILTGLKQATHYQIVVQAFNNKGAGMISTNHYLHVNNLNLFFRSFF